MVDTAGKLVGIVSEGDFIRRVEIGMQHKRGRWSQFFAGAGQTASEFVHESGRKVREIMTLNPVTVTDDTSLEDIVRIIEQDNVKHLPVLRGDQVVGIVTRSNLLRAIAAIARDIPDASAEDEQIRNSVIAAIKGNNWAPSMLDVIVCNGIVHLGGSITDERSRQATVVAADNIPSVR